MIAERFRLVLSFFVMDVSAYQVVRYASALVGREQPNNAERFVCGQPPIDIHTHAGTYVRTVSSFASHCKWQTVVLAVNIGRARRLQAGWQGLSTFRGGQTLYASPFIQLLLATAEWAAISLLSQTV